MSTAPVVPAPTQAEPASLPVHHSWITNREIEGRAGLRPVISPANGARFADVSLLDADQAGEAVAAAHAAFPAWSALSFRERGKHLLKLHDAVLAHADELAELIAREQGKPPAEAHMVEIFPALEGLRHLALEAEELLRDDVLDSRVVLFAHKEARLVYAPIGPMLAITPWNYPFAISVSSIASPLIAGNTVVLKPAPSTSLVGLRLGQLAREAGLPDGVLGVITVDDGVAGQLVEDPRFRKIIFTGSVATGRRVMTGAAKNLTPVLLELGGKDPAIVCRDADLDRAADGIVWGAFLNSGQTCASVERVCVEAPVAEAFVAKVVERTRALRQGDPLSAEVDVGPMALERQRQIVEDHVADALACGAQALVGGQTPDGPGFFYPPTVLTGVTPAMKVMREETFGPLLPIMVVADLDEAIRLANDSEFGLTASGWTRSRDTAERLQRELQAGVVSINDCVCSYGEPTAPWGGFKQSGVGRIHGLPGLREMVQVKYVSHDDSRKPSLWWYPYGAEFGRLASTANEALHAPSFWARLRGQVRLMRFGRFWKRARLLDVALNFDKML